MSNKIKTTIISHANCTDGMMAAFLYYVYYKFSGKIDEVEFIFCQYNKPVPEINGDEVVVVDFSFTKEQMESEQFSNKTVTTLDHHESSALGYAGWGKYFFICGNNCKHQITFRKDKSGAGLAWRDIAVRLQSALETFTTLSIEESRELQDHLATIAERVQDRDLWTYRYDDTRAMYEVLNSVPKTLEAWWELIMETPREEFKKMIHEADIRVKMRLQPSAEYASKATVFPYKDNTFAILNCSSNFASEVGDILGKQHAFAAMFIVSPKEKAVRVSLRSNAETGVDVSVIAKSFGGGGHVNAASFSFDYEKEPTKFLSLMNGSLFNPKEKVINFNTEIDSVQTVIELSKFYTDWFRTYGGDEGIHSIQGEELTMMLNIREFFIVKHRKTFSIMDIMEMLLNDVYLKATLSDILI